MKTMRASILIDGQEVPFVATISADRYLTLRCPVKSPIHWRGAEDRLAKYARTNHSTIDWLGDWEREDGAFIRQAELISMTASKEPATA